MTRLKLIPWLALTVLVAISGALLPSTAAAADGSQTEDGLIYHPLDASQLQDAATARGLQTSLPGQVTMSQHGVPDVVVGNNNGMLAVRFDAPFDAPYTITGITFSTRTQFQLPAVPGRFISIRILGMNPLTGLPDKTMEYYQQRRVAVSSIGGSNTIPLNIAGSPGQTFFAVFHFPRPPASADTFPFIFTDRQLTDRGLYANSYATDTNAVARPTLGAEVGGALLYDQNLAVSMSFQASGAVGLGSPKSLGLNLRDEQVNFTYRNPDNILADGEAAPNGHLEGVELAARNITWGAPVATGGAGPEKITLPSVPGSGVQVWAVRSVDKAGQRSAFGNVIVTGAPNLTLYGPQDIDADEANGRANETEAAALTPPVAGRPESIWPCGDQDNYWFYAQPGQTIGVTASPQGNDFRNDMALVVNILDNSGDVVASAIGAPGAPVVLNYAVAPPSGNSGSKAFKRHIVQVYDLNGSPQDPDGNWCRVLVPSKYGLSVDVTTPAPFVLNEPGDEAGSIAGGADEFAFAVSGSNPARGHAAFGYAIPRSHSNGSVKLRIYDVRGRLLSTLVNGSKPAGQHFAAWSGHDARGNRAASGTYFARFQAGSFNKTVRIVLN